MEDIVERAFLAVMNANDRELSLPLTDWAGRNLLKRRIAVAVKALENRWLPIEQCPSQNTVLVCNDCLLGWWAVAIQSALGEWHYDGTQAPLKYQPTHFQELPSIHPIAIRRTRQ